MRCKLRPLKLRRLMVKRKKFLQTSNLSKKLSQKPPPLIPRVGRKLAVKKIRGPPNLRVKELTRRLRRQKR